MYRGHSLQIMIKSGTYVLGHSVKCGVRGDSETPTQSLEETLKDEIGTHEIEPGIFALELTDK